MLYNVEIWSRWVDLNSILEGNTSAKYWGKGIDGYVIIHEWLYDDAGYQFKDIEILDWDIWFENWF